MYKVDTPPGANVPTAVITVPREILLGFNAEGMHVYTLNHKLLLSFPFADIYRWGGSSSRFSLIVADPDVPNNSFEFVIITSQSADMVAIILDHIQAIMVIQESADGSM